MTTLRIMLVGKIVSGEFSWDVAPLPVEEQAPADGELQGAIDYGAETQDYQDYLEDIEFWRHGQW